MERKILWRKFSEIFSLITDENVATFCLLLAYRDVSKINLCVFLVCFADTYNDPEPLYKPCTYHNVMFSTNMAYFLLECLGPGIPTVTLYATNNRHINISSNTTLPIPIPKPLLVLQNNTKLYVSYSFSSFDIEDEYYMEFSV